MIDRIAHDVGQRIADHLDHLAIELDVAAFDIDQDLLAELGRQVANHARQSDEEVLDPLHARAGNRVAHVGNDRREALECAVDRHVGRRFTQPAGELVARQHHVGNRAHHSVEKLDRQADGARRRRRLAGTFGEGGDRRRALCTDFESGYQSAVVAGEQLVAGFDLCDHLADPVDDREHRGDHRTVGLAAARANVGERILGGVAERLKPRKFEEAAIAFDGVDEAEDGIEPRTVVGLRLPGDDFAAQGLKHLPAFSYEIGDQIVHWRAPSPGVRPPYAGEELTLRYP